MLVSYVAVIHSFKVRSRSSAGRRWWSPVRRRSYVLGRAVVPVPIHGQVGARILQRGLVEVGDDRLHGSCVHSRLIHKLPPGVIRPHPSDRAVQCAVQGR